MTPAPPTVGVAHFETSVVAPGWAEAASPTPPQAVDPLPVRLRIPAIEVDTEVEAVGQTTSGAMDVPQNVDNVAWYELGALPGRAGNAVIAGHLDRVGGAPAVFWELDKLQLGDEILVEDVTGTTHRYQVVNVESYPYDQAPIADIFGFTLESRLNLITCRGRWDRVQQTYANRLVVFAEFVESIPAGL
jgi:LPXTG-site transpeptidase (sortase) family protein